MPKFTSSNVAEIGHDPATNTLAVKFRNGGVFHYSGVDAEKFAEMKQAESVGRFLHSEIKGKHAHRRIDEQEENQ